MTYEAWNEMAEEGDEIQIGVINENGRTEDGDGDGSGDQSEIIVNSKSSIDTVEKRKFWPILDVCQLYFGNIEHI